MHVAKHGRRLTTSYDNQLCSCATAMTQMTIDYARPISDAEPCGEASDYDLSFLELEIVAKGKPSRELGDSLIAAQPPDWAEVNRLATELSAKTKDIRIADLAARAALHIEGLDGLGRGLFGLCTYIEAFWETLHPLPDPDDGDDNTVRVSALADICDADGLIADLRQFPLARSRIFGSVSLRDWQDAHRALSAPDDGLAADMAQIRSCLADARPDAISETYVSLNEIAKAFSRLQAAVNSRVPPPIGPSLATALETVGQMKLVIADLVPQEEQKASSEPALVESQVLAIESRNDVVVALDRICRWYRLNEPSSPVPTLLERVRGLVAKDFLSLLLDLAPNGAPEFRNIAGLPADGTQRP